MKKGILMLFVVLVGQFLSGQVTDQEKNVLIDLYNSAKGDSWIIKWDLNAPVSTWEGVTLENNKVVSVNLMNNNLKGSIPNSIGDLKNLKVLNLALNNIGGSIPESITELKKLVVLRLGKNKITGTIPNNIGSLERLLVLDLFYNDLSGELPLSMGEIKSLRVILLSHNGLSGSIPLAFGNLKNLERLELGDNNFDFDGGNHRNFDLNKINSDKDVRTADTRFEDSFN